MTRRGFLLSVSLTATALRAEKAKTGVGIATTSYMTVWKPKNSLEFLEHCHGLGAGGIQVVLSGDLEKLRARAEEYGMYIEAMIPLPRGSDTAKFEASLQDAKKAGVIAIRSGGTGGRRYESFTSLAEWKKFYADNIAGFEAAVPLLDKYKIPLGMENYKDFTLDEIAVIFKRFSSAYFGSCVDFGNNLSLLDDPMDTIAKLAPYAVTVHLKDMSVAPYEDGFLLSEVPLGEGFLDIPSAVAAVRQARPNAKFLLEMITRDPLKVPCLTDKYWATFPERNGKYLARTLTLVHQHAKSLPQIAQLSHEDQLRVEADNVKKCLRYVAEAPGFS